MTGARSVGADPGLASTGIAAIERREDGQVYSLGCKLIKTVPMNKAEFRHTRKASEDMRRIHEIWSHMRVIIDGVKPNVLGVETYTIFEPKDASDTRTAAEGLLGLFNAFGGSIEQVKTWLVGDGLPHLLGAAAALRAAIDTKSTIAGRGQASKTMLVYSSVMCLGFERSISVLPFMPYDVKMRMCNKRGASKAEVGDAVYTSIIGAQEACERAAPKSAREHVCDSYGIALLALEQYERDATAYGTGSLSGRTVL